MKRMLTLAAVAAFAAAPALAQNPPVRTRTETQAPGDTRATLHYNAVPAPEEVRLAEVLKSSKVVVQAVGLETIRYCPFCGATLGA